ncbi:MAG: lysophospholipid acyltransferase family protein [Fuerstiella sp.]|nr:lysophospholipid acyltransferase family protein [Fuerstiella sp.]
MDARKFRHFCEYVFFCAVLFLLRCLPVRSARRCADSAAWFLHCVVPRRLTRYGISAENIRQALGEDYSDADVDRMTYGMWRHLFRMVCEIIQLERRFRLYNCTDVLRFYQRNECIQAVATGRPVLFLGGHFGNWEISVNTFGHFDFPMGVVARDLDNPWLDAWFRRFRESTGNWTISKSGASTQLLEELSVGNSVSLLCDQDAGRRGVFVDFFGKPASTFKSIALLALQYDAIIVVGGAWRLPDDEQYESRWTQFELATEDVIDSREFTTADAVVKITQEFTTALESLVRRAPDQYFWVHRRWKSAPRVKQAKQRRQSA